MKLFTRGTKNFQNLHLPWVCPCKVKDNNFDGSFHQAVAPVLFLGQCITLMPVVEIFNPNYRYTRFKPLSVRFVHTMIFLIFGGFYTGATCRRLIRKGLNVTYFGDFVYVMVCYATAVLLLPVAVRWSSVLKKFGDCERLMLQDAYTNVTKRLTRFNLAWRIRLVVLGIMSLAVVEDSLNYYSAYQDNIVQMKFCNATDSFWENLYVRVHPQIFKLIPVNIGSILLVEWINHCMRYTWTYLDVFIISFSTAAQFRYNQIYQRLASTEGTSYPPTFWRDIRTDYVAVSQLVAFLNNAFGHLILLACANDMYFIANQLFHGTQHRPAQATTIYFWYSMSFLIFRTLCMIYIGSGVHVASMSPLSILQNIPSKHWGVDLQRLTDDIVSDVHALSGKQFFHLKRQLILAVGRGGKDRTSLSRCWEGRNRGRTSGGSKRVPNHRIVFKTWDGAFGLDGLYDHINKYGQPY